MEKKKESVENSNLWIYQMLVCTLLWGVGNTIFGGFCVTQSAFEGAIYTVPSCLFCLLFIRAVQIFRVWKRNESWFDKRKSCYWRPKRDQSQSPKQHEFDNTDIEGY